MKTTKAIAMLVLGLCSTTFAAGSDADLRSELEALKAQVKTQQGEISQLRSANGDTWLNERRAEEVKALVKEVLSDADTRASLAEGGATAGHKNGHFFLASEDGNFLLNLSGQVQFRYIMDSNDTHPSSPRQQHLENNSGFQNRRTVVAFSGHLFDPKFTYKVSLFVGSGDELNTSTESHVTLQNSWFAYQFADGWQVKGGQFKAPFLRDELVHSSKQQAVERAGITDIFTVDYTQGVQVSYSADMFRVFAMVHDGSYAANTDYNGDGVDVAVAARAEVLLAGTWKQFDDYQAWSKDKFALLLGAAVDYENAKGETAGTSNDTLKWTVDVDAKFPELMGLSIMAAVIGNHPQDREHLSGAGFNEPDQIAFMVQAGLFVIPDKMDIFVRWEHMDNDSNVLNSTAKVDTNPAVDTKLDTLTFGTNYYFHGHAAKATLDVVWYLDTTSEFGASPNTGISSNTGSGFLTSNADNEVAIRAQFQFLF